MLGYRTEAVIGVQSVPDQRAAGPAIVSELRAVGFDDPEEVGRGGFGIVYRCMQARLDRMVAVKVLTGSLADNRDRFVREQRAMGRLTGHPNIVGVLHVGDTACGYPFLVMQYHRRGSLQQHISDRGSLEVEELLRLGVRLAGALDSAHTIGIVHRDVKPANVLFTDFGEPALCDFGIARMSGAFETGTGFFAGSPAFTAPEVIRGDAPSAASDVYGLGATLFAGLTGHAAFERRVGEQVVAQLVRITREPLPDLRKQGIPVDVAVVVENAMSRVAGDRPSPVELGRQLQGLQAARGLPVTQMALRSQPESRQPGPTVGRVPVSVDRVPASAGNLPQQLSGFVGRRAEVAEVRRAVDASRLVTVTGMGGVGKTRLSLRAAALTQPDFADGVWLAELAEVRDAALLTDVVAASLSLRDQPGRSIGEVLVDHLRTRRLLLVLDNCEQVIDDVAKLVETLLRDCPDLHILATSREPLDIGAELVMPLSPLACPDPLAQQELTLSRLGTYDALALFAQRAAARVPEFALADDNVATVAQICARLDGLPLAIELAAGRLAAMSLEQILAGLNDRFAFLTQRHRRSPARLQSLIWCVRWSYELCTPTEQRLWARLAVFAGGFEMDAAADICGGELDRDDVLDLVCALVDKSILTRTEVKGRVRLGFLETIREFGRDVTRRSGEDVELRRRHARWFGQLVHDYHAGWVSPQQGSWIDRLGRELANIREALEFTLADDPDTALAMAATLNPFFISRGLHGEGRRWMDRVLAATPRRPTIQRVTALYYANLLAGLHGDPASAVIHAGELRTLLEPVEEATLRALAGIAEGFTALFGGDLDRACASVEAALAVGGIDLPIQCEAMLDLIWAHELRGDPAAALAWNDRLLALAGSRGDSMYRSYALWARGVAMWREGDRDTALEHLEEGLGLAYQLRDPSVSAVCIHALAWVAGERQQWRRAVVMMAAADAVGQNLRSSIIPIPALLEYRDQCERRAREVLGDDEYDQARGKGQAMTFSAAVAYSLGE